jgi:oligopeptide/dipeptide ABC transporter ATP-binding protein
LIVITHDLGVVARIATRVLVMYAGRVVEYGDADEVFDQPMHPYTRALLRSVDFAGGVPRTRLYALEGYPPQLGDLPSGCAFHPRCGYCLDICRQLVPELGPLPEGGSLSACHLATQGRLPPDTPERQPASATGKRSD